jgi:uncharacterized protein (TIGR03083 family)
MATPIDRAAFVQANHELRARTTALLRAVGDADADRAVATCPGWGVRELASHMVGVVEDVATGNMEGAASDAWTTAQVDRHRGASCAALADRWLELADAFDAVFAELPDPFPAVLMMDQTTHEQDLRATLGSFGAQDDGTAAAGLAYPWSVLERSDPELAAAIDALNLSTFERFRIVTGRRSVAQLTALGVPVDALVAVLERTPMRVAAQDVVDA